MFAATPIKPAFPDPCDLPGAKLTPPCQIKDIGKGAVETISFMKDPLGYIASKEQQSAESMATNLLPAMNKALHPDFTVKWFLTAYQYAFALGVIVMGVLIGYQFLQHARNKVSGEDLLETFTDAVPKFFLGCSFGPVIANFFMNLIGALCDSVISWGGGSGGMLGASKQFAKLIKTVKIESMLGGAFVGCVLFGLMVLAFLMVAVTLLFMYVTLYMSGSVFPIGWAWIIRPENRDKGWKILKVFAGIMCAQPLVFFMLQVVLSMVAANLFGFLGKDGDKTNTFVGLLASVLALSMLAVTPFAAGKWAPVGPSDASPSGVGAKGFGSGSRGGAGNSSPSSSQLSQIAGKGGGGEAAGAEAGAGAGAGGAGAGAGAGAGGGGAAAAGGLAGPLGMAAAAALQKGKQAWDKARGSAEEATDDATKGSDSGTDSSATSDSADGNASDGESQGGQSGTEQVVNQNAGASGGGSGDGPDRDGDDSDDKEKDDDQSGGGALVDLSKSTDGDKGDDPSGDKGGDKPSGDGASGASGGKSSTEGGDSMFSKLVNGAKGAHQQAGKTTGHLSSVADLMEEQTDQHLEHHRDQPRPRR